MMPLSTAQRGKLHRNISRSQQTLLSSLSPPCPPSTAAQRGILTAGGSHYRPLASSLRQAPESQLFSGTLHALRRRKIPGICLGLWEPLASFLLRKQLESCPQKLICELHSLQKFYQLAHFKQVFTEGWESWTGWKNWTNAFAYPRHQILRPKSFFTKSPVKAFYRCKNMQATFSFSPSHLPGPRVTRKLHIFSAYLGKCKHPPFPASVCLRTDWKD